MKLIPRRTETIIKLNNMAYYGTGKYPFIDLINKFVGNPHVQSYLIYKRSKWFTEDMFDKPKKCCVEQWLYNESADEISTELNGFIAGITFETQPYPVVDQVIAHRKLFAELCKIWNYMESKNNWSKDESWSHMSNMVDYKTH